MPSNIEVKARARNFAAIKARAQDLSDTPVEVIPQEDTFFNTIQGRLKLRVLSEEKGAHLLHTSRQGKSEAFRLSYFPHFGS